MCFSEKTWTLWLDFNMLIIYFSTGQLYVLLGFAVYMYLSHIWLDFSLDATIFHKSSVHTFLVNSLLVCNTDLSGCNAVFSSFVNSQCQSLSLSITLVTCMPYNMSFNKRSTMCIYLLQVFFVHGFLWVWAKTHWDLLSIFCRIWFNTTWLIVSCHSTPAIQTLDYGE